jgi:nitrile hydratase
MSHDHGHDHDHGGHHHPLEKSENELRVEALEALLAAKGLVSAEAIDAVVSYYENDVGPQNGARVVARAWADPSYKTRLLADGTAAVKEFGFTGFELNTLVAVENSPAVHNVVVCTLCSCYPWPILGLPPTWYKSAPYRARVVSEPRAVLREFGLELPSEVELRVWDSTAEVRYLVVPERPAGTDGWSEDELVRLVPRDAMIGTAKAFEPMLKSSWGQT